jgi:hypothetical protein
MPEPFINLFSKKVIAHIGDHFVRAWAEFPRDEFVAVASDGLDGLESKQRSERITQAMAIFLPADFEAAQTLKEKPRHLQPSSLCVPGGMGDSRGWR